MIGSWFLGISVPGFGTLLGPEETPVGVFSGCSWPGLSNALRLLGWWWLWWVGVWLCVECCIVDASILL
jgi:hypothetical protein